MLGRIRFETTRKKRGVFTGMSRTIGEEEEGCSVRYLRDVKKEETLRSKTRSDDTARTS